ncbi:uncharacterized protein LOC119593811 [Penaeus monodon]|uniref:uncharacterized protein LOC119593811 n=1 Tax=Penaeus monodon TaxID=6687 RepID=UPI0018A73100|nr:uncharacterized protein LOC119593811 [Penaeus monodon]
MASHGITFAALLTLAALTHAADTAHKNDARLFYDDNTSLTIGKITLSYIGVIFVGILLFSSFLGLFGTLANVAQPYDFAPSTAYGASVPAYVQKLIEDAVNKFL